MTVYIVIDPIDYDEKNPILGVFTDKSNARAFAYVIFEMNYEKLHFNFEIEKWIVKKYVH